MTAKACKWVEDHGPGADQRVLYHVLHAIAWHATDAGENSFPGSARLAQRTRYSTARIFQALTQLKNEGWIEVTEEGGGRGNRTVYRIPGIAASRVERAHTQPALDFDKLSALDDKLSNPGAETLKSGLPSPLIGMKEQQGTPEFREFWNVYPHKIKRGSARRAFDDACTKTTPERIVAAANRYARSRELPDLRWIPSPSSWLQDERWDDGDIAEPARPHLRSVSATDCSVCGNDRWVPESEGSTRMIRCACVTEAVG